MLVFYHHYFCCLAFALGASVVVYRPDGTTWDHLPVLGGGQRLLMPGAALMLKKVTFWGCMC